VRRNPRRWCPPLQADGDPVPDVPPSHAELEGRVVGLEAGCGCGSATFPLARANPDAFLFACDFSAAAVTLLKRRDEYEAQLRADKRRVYAFVADVADEESWLDDLARQIGGLHFVTLVYVLSALQNPADMRRAVVRLARLLRPGGLFFFRDYAAGDMKQAHFDERPHNALPDGTYRRGEGTFAHYFEKPELQALFESDGLLVRTQLVNVERQIVNRKADLTMNRLWIQAKYRRAQQPGEPRPVVLPGDDDDDDDERGDEERGDEEPTCCWWHLWRWSCGTTATTTTRCRSTTVRDPLLQQ